MIHLCKKRKCLDRHLMTQLRVLAVFLNPRFKGGVCLHVPKTCATATIAGAALMSPLGGRRVRLAITYKALSITDSWVIY